MILVVREIKLLARNTSQQTAINHENIENHKYNYSMDPITTATRSKEVEA